MNEYVVAKYIPRFDDLCLQYGRRCVKLTGERRVLWKNGIWK
jgi:hypothetical protein